MTTTVTVFPNPGHGLRVKVTIHDKGGPEDGRVEYLESGSGERHYHVSPGGAFEGVAIQEVPLEDVAKDEVAR